jgi:hypothetical protein
VRRVHPHDRLAEAVDRANLTGTAKANTGIVNASIEIHSPGLGATKAGDYFTSGDKSDPFKLSNCIPAGKSQLSEMQPYLDRLRGFVATARGPGANGSGASVSVADELQKLAALRDSGVLTDDEFATQKARLLS